MVSSTAVNTVLRISLLGHVALSQTNWRVNLNTLRAFTWLVGWLDVGSSSYVWMFLFPRVVHYPKSDLGGALIGHVEIDRNMDVSQPSAFGFGGENTCFNKSTRNKQLSLEKRRAT